MFLTLCHVFNFSLQFSASSYLKQRYSNKISYAFYPRNRKPKTEEHIA